MTSREKGLKGKDSSQSNELGIENFAAGLLAHAIAYGKTY
jgi:hypothetical protein